MLKSLSRQKNPFFAAIIVLVFMFAMYAAMGFFPFGTNCISWCDMNQQVVPLMLNLKDILAGSDGFFLNNANAGGMNFLAVFFFFLSSPFALIVAFVEKSNMMSFMNILVAFKMALAAGTACAFFDRSFGRSKSVSNIALGFAYGTCGYAMHYYQIIMWLDMMYIFPLLIISMEKLYSEKKPIMYILCLAMAIYLNYYIGFMVIIYVLLSSGCYLLLLTSKEERCEFAVQFCASSVLSALLSAPVWIPSAMQVMDSARMEGLLASLSTGGLSGYSYTTWPLLYCTPMIFAALPFANRWKLSKREDRIIIFWFLLFILTVLPQFIEPINKMWHTGNYMSFPYRYGFMAVFCGLVLTGHTLEELLGDSAQEQETKASIKVWHIIALVAIGVLLFFGEYLFATIGEELFAYTRTLWGNKQSFNGLSAYFAVGVAVFLSQILLVRQNVISREVFSFSVFVMLIIVGVFNFRIYMGSVSQDASGFRSVVELEGKIEDDSFYRVKVAEKLFDVNMIGAAGYNSLAHYTSLTSEEYMFALKKLGYSSYWMEVNSDGGTAFSDALLSNNYTIKRMWQGSPGTVIASTSHYNILKNEITFPPALFSTADPQFLRDLSEGSRVQRQAELSKSLFNESLELFTEYQPTKADDILFYELTISGRAALYFDCFDALSNRLREPINDSYKVSVNGIIIAHSYPSQRQNGILFLGEFVDSQVSVEVEVLKDVTVQSFGVFCLDMNRLAEVAEKTSGTEIDIQGNTVSIDYNAPMDGYLYLSLPNLRGYELVVNGKQSSLYRVHDAFMAIAVTKGTNSIMLRYTPPGLILGIVLFCCGASLTASRMVKGNISKLKNSTLLRLVYIFVIIGITATFITVYVFPPMYNLISKI